MLGSCLRLQETVLGATEVMKVRNLERLEQVVFCFYCSCWYFSFLGAWRGQAWSNIIISYLLCNGSVHVSYFGSCALSPFVPDNSQALFVSIRAICRRKSKASEHGLFHGVMTVRQLLQKDSNLNDLNGSRWKIPRVEIRDEPALHWRGLMFFGQCSSRSFVCETERL